MNCQWWTGGLPWYEKKVFLLIQASHSKSTTIPGWSRHFGCCSHGMPWTKERRNHGSKLSTREKKIWMVHSNPQKKKEIPLKEWSSKYCSIFWVDYYRRNKNIRLISNIAIKNLQFSSFFSPAINIRGRDFPWACHVRFLLRLLPYHPVSPDFLGKIDGWLITKKKTVTIGQVWSVYLMWQTQ